MWFVQGGGQWEKVSSEIFNTNVNSSHFSVGEYRKRRGKIKHFVNISLGGLPFPDTACICQAVTIKNHSFSEI